MASQDSSHWDKEVENLAPKRRRISPMEVKRSLCSPSPFSKVNPATEALERFLRMAVEDFTPAFDLDDAGQSIPFQHSKICAFPLETVSTTVHELTCSMARVSASI